MVTSFLSPHWTAPQVRWVSKDYIHTCALIGGFLFLLRSLSAPPRATLTRSKEGLDKPPSAPARCPRPAYLQVTPEPSDGRTYPLQLLGTGLCSFRLASPRACDSTSDALEQMRASRQLSHPHLSSQEVTSCLAQLSSLHPWLQNVNQRRSPA